MVSDDNYLELLFRTLSRMQVNYINTEFMRQGISTASHPFILLMLRGDVPDMSASQAEISRVLGISPPTVAVSVKRMEKAGLLRKLADKADLRRNTITLTEEGRRVAERCACILERISCEILRDFTPEDRAQLTEYYLRIISNLADMGAQTPAELIRNEPAKDGTA